MAAAVRVFVPRNLIPLQQAVLCANCEVISDGKNGRCVVCGSPSLLNLARVLNGSNHRVERPRAWGRRARAAACDSASNRE
jgi:hypothetical protein